MKLKREIDCNIQKELMANGLYFPLLPNNNIHVAESRMDSRANMAMLYLLPKKDLPEGKLPFMIISAKYVYSVFYYKKKAAILEVNTSALE